MMLQFMLSSFLFLKLIALSWIFKSKNGSKWVLLNQLTAHTTLPFLLFRKKMALLATF